MTESEIEHCPCGLVVFSREELDYGGLCCDCASTGDGEICVCTDCDGTRERVVVLSVPY